MPIALSEDQKALAESVAAVTARHAGKTATRAEFEYAIPVADAEQQLKSLKRQLAEKHQPNEAHPQ